jgi:ATP-dependent DNA helicase RecG
MFEESIKEGKAVPDYSGTDSSQVSLVLHGEVQHPEFLRFLEKIGNERLARFTTRDLLVLDLLQRDQRVPEELRFRLSHLLEQGVIERIGRGRGVRYVLSRKFYSFLGRTGTYTRRRGLDRETQKSLLLRHLQHSGRDGARLQDLLQVLPELSRGQVQTLLKELKRECRAHVVGQRRAGIWLLGTSESEPI